VHGSGFCRAWQRSFAAVERDSVELRKSYWSSDGSAERRPTQASDRPAGQLRLCPNAFARYHRTRVHIGMHVTITEKPISDFLSQENTWAVNDSD